MTSAIVHPYTNHFRAQIPQLVNVVTEFARLLFQNGPFLRNQQAIFQNIGMEFLVFSQYLIKVRHPVHRSVVYIHFLSYTFQ